MKCSPALNIPGRRQHGHDDHAAELEQGFEVWIATSVWWLGPALSRRRKRHSPAFLRARFFGGLGKSIDRRAELVAARFRPVSGAGLRVAIVQADLKPAFA